MCKSRNVSTKKNEEEPWVQPPFAFFPPSTKPENRRQILRRRAGFAHNLQKAKKRSFPTKNRRQLSFDFFIVFYSLANLQLCWRTSLLPPTFSETGSPLPRTKAESPPPPLLGNWFNANQSTSSSPFGRRTRTTSLSGLKITNIFGFFISALHIRRQVQKCI